MMEIIFICEKLQDNIFNFISDTVPIKYLPDGTNVLCSLIFQILRKATVLMRANLFYTTVEKGFIRF